MVSTIIAPQIGHTALQTAKDQCNVKCAQLLTDSGAQTVDVQDEV